MQQSDRVAINTHRKVQASTTLNRKYVKRPMRNTDVTMDVRKSPRVQHFASTRINVRVSDGSEVQPARTAQIIDQPARDHAIQAIAKERMQARAMQAQQPLVSKMTAKELKDRAIQKALASAANTPTISETVASENKKKASKMHFGAGRVMLALSCAAAIIFAVAYFVNLNMPDISLKVAAMQTGIDATYPGYIPRGYNLSEITSENGKITLKFLKSGSSSDGFTIIEEKSAWDSNALLSNYIKPEFKDDYSIVREQGLTIYIGSTGAAWVNGGVVYKLSFTGERLTNQQVRSIAVSL